MKLVQLDTIKIVIGFPVFIFEDNSNNPTTYWTITKSPAIKSAMGFNL